MATRPFLKSRMLRISLWRRWLAGLATFAVLPAILLLDITVSLFSPISRILLSRPHLRRRDHVVIDRYRLTGLTRLERLACTYCGYTNGVIAWARAVAADTETAWCPIRHEKDSAEPHESYADFDDYEEHLAATQPDWSPARASGQGGWPGGWT